MPISFCLRHQLPFLRRGDRLRHDVKVKADLSVIRHRVPSLYRCFSASDQGGCRRVGTQCK